jgi:hypothetical protein
MVLTTIAAGAATYVAYLAGDYVIKFFEGLYVWVQGLM